MPPTKTRSKTKSKNVKEKLPVRDLKLVVADLVELVNAHPAGSPKVRKYISDWEHIEGFPALAKTVVALKDGIADDPTLRR